MATPGGSLPHLRGPDGRIWRPRWLHPPSTTVSVTAGRGMVDGHQAGPLHPPCQDESRVAGFKRPSASELVASSSRTHYVGAPTRGLMAAPAALMAAPGGPDGRTHGPDGRTCRPRWPHLAAPSCHPLAAHGRTPVDPGRLASG